MKECQKSYFGFFAIVGRPNVGKSTLLNQLVQRKISIVSSKPHTTRHCIMGIHTEDIYQTVYLDTPGLHIKEKNLINRLMNRVAISCIADVELVIFVIEGIRWTPDDEMVLQKLRQSNIPVLLVINKIDYIKNKKRLLQHLCFVSQKMHFIDIVPISAKFRTNLNIIANIVRKHLPFGIHHFPKCYTNYCSKNFMVSELIREKLMNFLNNELPYSLTVKIEDFVLNNHGNYNIKALIIVERNSQKKIVIGNKGSMIKQIGIKARKNIEEFFSIKVHLTLWVKVKSGWVDNQYMLYNLGLGYNKDTKIVF
ncbi:GTPase Era [Candidatus Pantoea carbekii]|uniref:GTPase Era n=1 Tax=Candidatus Pantoea carbekii TaxID=1235990 RepID=UPI00061876EF|nr:GTPase Era [Candidatus Pantoea carbekii]AKC31872.1 GTP-binding protein Era [Candidatus Pantoea carbekii]